MRMDRIGADFAADFHKCSKWKLLRDLQQIKAQ
jgi:hypothetical protein